MSAMPPLRPFPQTDRPAPPAVDPVTGRQPRPDPPVGDPLRICLLSATYPPEQFDGIARLTHLMARGLFELGHTVHVIARGERERVTFRDGAYIHRIPYRLERYDRYRRYPSLYHALNYSHAVHERVKRLVWNDGIQIVDSPIWQAEGLVTTVGGSPPVVVRLVTSYRQIAAMQGLHDENARLMGEIEELFLRQAAHLLPNTEATLTTVRRLYDLPSLEGRYTIVPYGIVPAPDEATRPFDTAHPPDTLTVLFVGRLEQRKGILDLFAAIPQVFKRVRKVRFLLAGQDNSQHDGFRRREGLDYPTYFARRYGKYSAQVKFLGRVGDEELNALYRSCDLFVAPSLYESFGLTYLEAMNYAKPVIGCRSGGVPEVVEDGVTGLLVEPQSPTALADALVTLLTSPRQLRQMGLAGRRRLLDKFTYLEMARRFAAAYRRVIQERA